MKKLTLLLLLFPFFFSCSDDDSADEIRNERLNQIVKKYDSSAEKYRDYEELYITAQETDVYSKYKYEITLFERELQEAIEESNLAEIQKCKDSIEKCNIILKELEKKHTQPIYTVTYEGTVNELSSCMIMYVNKDYAIIGVVSFMCTDFSK